MPKLNNAEMGLKVILCALLTFCASHVAAQLNLTKSHWIWKSATVSVPANEVGDFRRDFSSPSGKMAVAADILIGGDDNYALYVNGELIGQANHWTMSDQYCVRLNPTSNVFAVSVQNTDVVPNPAGILTAISITYTDGSSEVIVSDTNWRANNATSGFQSPHFDDSAWPYAALTGRTYIPAPPLTPSSLSFNSSYWIWTNEATPGNPPSGAPVGARAFRKTFEFPNGLQVSTGNIIIAADDAFTLYINGNQIGSAPVYGNAYRYTFTLDYPTDNIVIAVLANNTIAINAGLVVAVAFDAADCGCNTTIFTVSDNTWKYNLTVPVGFEQPNYDDSAWHMAVEEVAYGGRPWGRLPIKGGN